MLTRKKVLQPSSWLRSQWKANRCQLFKYSKECLAVYHFVAAIAAATATTTRSPSVPISPKLNFLSTFYIVTNKFCHPSLSPCLHHAFTATVATFISHPKPVHCLRILSKPYNRLHWSTQKHPSFKLNRFLYCFAPPVDSCHTLLEMIIFYNILNINIQKSCINFPTNDIFNSKIMSMPSLPLPVCNVWQYYWVRNRRIQTTGSFWYCHTAAFYDLHHWCVALQWKQPRSNTAAVVLLLHIENQQVTSECKRSQHNKVAFLYSL